MKLVQSRLVTLAVNAVDAQRGRRWVGWTRKPDFRLLRGWQGTEDRVLRQGVGDAAFDRAGDRRERDGTLRNERLEKRCGEAVRERALLRAAG